MEVKVIGSGSMWTKYNSASYIIDNRVVVDFPNGMCKYLFRADVNPRNISHVMLTHFHGDHYFDIPFFLMLKAKSDNNKVNIYCSKEGKKKIRKLLKLGFPNSTKGILNDVDLTYIYDDKFKIFDYDISKILVDHGRMKPAYGYIVEKNNKRIGFTGDCTLCNSAKYMAKTCDYLFCDCMFIKGTTKHMGIDMLKELIKENDKCKYIVSHLDDETRADLIKQKLKNVIVPEDCQIIEIV